MKHATPVLHMSLCMYKKQFSPISLYGAPSTKATLHVTLNISGNV